MCSLEGTLQSVTAALTAANAREHNLSVEVHRLGAASTPVDDQPPARQTKVDTRTLGKPDMFTSEEHKWQDWMTVVSAYCSVVDLQMGVIMDAIATGASTNSVNSDPLDFVAKVAQVQASTGNVHVVLAPLADTDYLLSAMIAAAIMGGFYATPQDRLSQDESPRGIMYTETYKRGCISHVAVSAAFHGAVSAALADELPALPQLVRAIALALRKFFNVYVSERKL